MTREKMTKEEFLAHLEEILSHSINDALKNIDIVEKLIQEYEEENPFSSDITTGVVEKLEKIKDMVVRGDFENYDLMNLCFDIEDISSAFERKREFEISDTLANVHTLVEFLPDTSKKIVNIDQEYEKYLEKFERQEKR